MSAASPRGERRGRRHPRRTVRIDVWWTAGDAWRCERATTLGAGGLFIASEAPPARGRTVRVRLRLSADAPEHELAARVAWSDERGMGLAFADGAERAALARELERTP